MKRPAERPRTSAAKAGWLIAVLIVAVPVFIFWPRAPQEAAPPPTPVTRPASELTKVGLPADPDLEGLPGFFAVWADYGEWTDNRTRFAYRHPVSGEFAFFFEATRTPEGFRFRPIARPEDKTLRELGPEIPIAFFGGGPAGSRASLAVPPPARSGPREAPRVQIDLGDAKSSAPRIDPPK